MPIAQPTQIYLLARSFPSWPTKTNTFVVRAAFIEILHAEKLLAYRSRSAPKKHKKPEELVATRPNQIWSWDITYLKASIKGTYFYLYLPMDIFPRKIVRWQIHANENAELAAMMIENT